MKTCEKCGALVELDELRCQNCGTFAKSLKDYGFRLQRMSQGFLLIDDKSDECINAYNRPTAERTKRHVADATEAPMEVVQHEIASLLMEAEEERSGVPKRKEVEILPKEVLEGAEEVLAGRPLDYITSTVGVLHAGDEEAAKIEYISALSARVTRTKINSWVIGKSGKGKTHLKYTIIQILPSELYEVFTSASPLSLFYYVKRYGEDALDGILIYIDEVEASKFALPMLRSLTGQTEITPRHLSVHDAEVLDLKIKGSRTVWFTSVKTFGSDQIKNRFIHTNPDESFEQDDRVFQLLDEIHRKGSKIPRERFDVCKAMTRLIIENTEDLQVKIPFEIDWPFKDRRFLYPMFLSFIKVLTKVHHKQRERDEDGSLVASIEDFETARSLWVYFERSIGYRVSPSALSVLDALPEKPENALTRSELTDHVPLSSRQIGNLCDELLEEGVINSRKRSQEGPGRNAWEYWRANTPSVSDIRILDESPLLDMVRYIDEEYGAFMEIRKSPLRLKKQYLLRYNTEILIPRPISEFPKIYEDKVVLPPENKPSIPPNPPLANEEEEWIVEYVDREESMGVLLLLQAYNYRWGRHATADDFRALLRDMSFRGLIDYQSDSGVVNSLREGNPL